jgi:DNA polymerase-3 subunit delta'
MMFEWQSPAWGALLQLRDKLPQAALIPCREGFGTEELAGRFAQALLCEAQQSAELPCGRCVACNWFEQGNHPDFRWVRPESMTPETAAGEEEGAPKEKAEKKRSEQIRIDQIRQLQDFLAVGTHRAGLRVILIHPAESMNSNTQNALLKSLEEPPPSTLFLLVSHHPDKLLATVRSRCRKFTLPEPARAPLLAWLKAEGVPDPEAALAATGGAPLSAAGLAESDPERQKLLNQLRNSQFNALAAAELLQRVAPAQFIHWLQCWVYDLLSCRLGGGVRYHLQDAKTMAGIAARTDPRTVATYLRSLAQARKLAQHPLNPKSNFEALLLQYQRLIGHS